MLQIIPPELFKNCTINLQRDGFQYQCYLFDGLSFLGTFARLRKVTVIFFISVSSLPSVHPVHTEQFGYQGADFHEIYYLNICQKSFEKIQVSLKPDKNNRYFT
jgi:hypothetical protein